MPDTGPFRQQVLSAARQWQRSGLPQRAELFFHSLALEFCTGLQLQNLDLDLTGLCE